MTVIPSLGTEKPSILSFGSPITTINIDGRFTGTGVSQLNSSLATWITLINSQAQLDNQDKTFAVNSTLSGQRNMKITEFSWNWSFQPSNDILGYKVAFTEGSGI